MQKLMLKESQAIATARVAMAAVDRRSRNCPSPLCRRLKRCLADPSERHNWNDKRGGCPITTRAEWDEIRPGLQASLQRVMDAVQAVMRVTGESFYATQKRLLVRDPNRTGERRVMMDLWRRG